MRIIGDLRWDKLTTPRQWIELFPQCLSPYSSEYPNQLEAPSKVKGIRSPVNPSSCKLTNVGISFYMLNVKLGVSPTGTSQTRTTEILLTIPDDAQHRAFSAAIREKYATTDSGNCSKFTCFSTVN